jgi:uncharacterized protein (TIGR03435 family)
MQDLDDTTLLREYVERDSEEAFAALVTRHVNKVYSVALRLTGNPHSAEEITQAVFVILAKKSRQLGKRVILSGWLYQTARLTAVTFIRGGIRRARREQEAYMQTVLNENESDLSRRSDTEADAIWKQFAPLLDAAMAGLNETDRYAVVLRFFDGKSIREVGAALGANEDAAKKRVSRALEKLRTFFARRGVSSTTAIIAGAISANSVQAAPVALAKAVTAIAVAKGAAASGSTLTLIKGALKIMAWTKAKSAIVGSVIVLLAAGTTTVTVKEIAAHKAEASWRVSNPNPDRAPLLVKILPTKFPESYDCMNVGSRDDNWIGVGEPVLQIARVAYGWRPGRILFAGTQPRERYDFISTLPQASGAALQAELKSKLGFVGHPEMRDTDVLVLKVRRPSAPGLLPPVSGHSDGRNKGHYYCDNSPIASDSEWYRGITRFLEEYFGMPVIDQTGLTQNYHIDLKWNERFKEDPDHDALKQALLDQLGLELLPANMPVEMLVVERANN